MCWQVPVVINQALAISGPIILHVTPEVEEVSVWVCHILSTRQAKQLNIVSLGKSRFHVELEIYAPDPLARVTLLHH